MPVKFKLGFTIDAETLFGIISKFLPVEDLVVEELAPPLPESKPLAISKPQRAPQVRKKKGSGYAVNLHAGINAVLMSVYGDGHIHHSAELRAAMRGANYSSNGMYGKINHLCRHGYLKRVDKAKHQITPRGKEVWEHPPAARENAA